MLGGKNPTRERIPLHTHPLSKMNGHPGFSKGPYNRCVATSFFVHTKPKNKTRNQEKFSAHGSCYAQIYIQSFYTCVCYIYLTLPKNA